MKTVVITGANRGIGLSFAKHYQTLGWTVYALCRNKSSALESLPVSIIEGIDVASDSSIEYLKSYFVDIKIDLLINNAGVLSDESLGNLNLQQIRQQFEINSLGPLRVTEALMASFQEGSKVALITSRMGSIADNSSGGRYGYRMSKAALNIAGMSLCHDLKPLGVAVAILHPGLVATEMIGGHGDISPQIAAQRLAERIEQLTIENSGSFWHSNGEQLPW